MYKAFLYRLYPSKPQTEKLGSLLEIARTFYNAGLQERREAWQKNRISLNYYDQANQLKEIRETTPEYCLLNYGVTQTILRRLGKAFKCFFRRVKNGEKPGYPRFKGKERFNSFTFPVYGDGIKLRDNRLYIQNVGEVKIRLHRDLEGKINTVTIKRQCDKWYAVFSNTVEINPLPTSDKQVGIDVGLHYFAVNSDGEIIDNPWFMREAETTVRKAQRKASRRKPGGRNRHKAVSILAKHYLKVKNQRRDFAHKLARQVVNTYGFIAVEDLQIKNMVRNPLFAQGILDAAWGQFLYILAYKAENAGRQFIRVNPSGTSQQCSNCGADVPKSLAVRIHRCTSCGAVLPRDFNSALNILALGRSVWSITCGNSQSVLQEAVAVS